MKNKIIKLFIIIVPSVIWYNCSEDFVNLKPLAKDNTASYFDSESNCLASLTACYSVLRAHTTYAVHYWFFGDVASDDSETGGEKGGNNYGSAQELDRMIHNSGNGICSQFWDGMYQGIYRCNTVIEKVGENTDFRKRLTGEAKFLRALFFFDLVKVFGGVPKVDHILTFSEMKMPRSSIAEIFALIESDLNYAIDALPPIYSNLSDEGRATRGAAKALLLKAYIFQSSYAERDDPNNIYTGLENKWEKARDLAEEIISDSTTYHYALEHDYKMIWRLSTEKVDPLKSTELVFKINATYNSSYYGEWLSDGSTNNNGIGSVICIYQSCRHYLNTTSGRNVSNKGWGFNCPTPELYNAFEDGDVRRNSSIITADDTLQAVVDGPWYHYNPGIASPTAMSAKKYTPTVAEWNKADDHGGPLDIKVIRYADVLLWAAEAYFKTGDEPTARKFVNMIRTRARNSGTTGVPMDYTAPISLDDIYLERRLELALEGHRFFDLVRTGKAYEKINGQYNYTIKSNLEFISGKNEYFPIPGGQVTISEGTLEQNSGY